MRVHRTDCDKVSGFIGDKSRIVLVAWDVENEDRFKSHIQIVADDRPYLLKDFTQMLASSKKIGYNNIYY